MLTTEASPVEVRPFDASVADIDEQRAVSRLSTPTGRRRTSPPRAPPAQLVALTETSPEMNFFNPCGVSTSKAP